MNCSDEIPSLAGLSPREQIMLLKSERNDFARSREKWIQAAFDIKKGDDTLFLSLCSTELCGNCIKTRS